MTSVFPFCPSLGCVKLSTNIHASRRPDNQVQGIVEIFENKRRECIERGLIKDKSKKSEPKKLAHEEVDNNNSSNMLIDNPPVPPPAVVVATSSRRKEKSISSLVNTTPPLVDDQVLNQHNVSSSTGIRRRGNVVRFQDSSKFNNVVELNNNQIKPGDLQPGISSIPLLSGKATQDKQLVNLTKSTLYMF
ncbi:Polycomb group RING finger protein 5 [Datura stramonium]|uniref:Polycomb group RING finger protein 5 n=1 Tax=Datura stramonium TaxID=4076 RepID=A0ABS8UZH2_DATST|nr:Polycomb group RING finger protein 5 [Datura stramonium]